MRLHTPRALRRALLPLAVGLAVFTAGALPLSAAAADSATEARTATPVIATPARAVDLDASFALGLAEDVVASAAGKVDATTLKVQIAQLDHSEELPEFAVTAFTGMLQTTTAETAAAVSAYDAEQARQAAAAAAAAQAKAEALARVNTVAGAKAYAAQLAASEYGWGPEQFSCLSSLWQKESGWNYQARNSSSGAAGIPQALPGSKMASVGSDWATNAATQIAWGLGYIAGSYGSPCAAWGHSQSTDWY